MSISDGSSQSNRIHQFQARLWNTELTEVLDNHNEKTGIDRARQEAWETSRSQVVQKFTNAATEGDPGGTKAGGNSNKEDKVQKDKPHENSNKPKETTELRPVDAFEFFSVDEKLPPWPGPDQKPFISRQDILKILILGSAYSMSTYAIWRICRNTVHNYLYGARNRSAILNQKPMPDEIAAAQERTRQLTIEVATDRTITSHDNKDMQMESLKLLDRYRNQNDNASADGKGLTAHIDAVRAFGLLAVPEIMHAANVTARTSLLNDVFKELQSLTNLDDEPLFKNAIVLADHSLTCGGRIQFRHRGQPIEPVFCEAERVFFRNAEGRLESAPVKDCSVLLRVASKTLEEAGPNGQMQASELVSTLFHQIEQISRLHGRLERAHKQGVDLKSDDATTFHRQESFLKREKEKSDVSSDYLQFILNRNSIDGKTFGDCVTFDIRNSANLTDLKGEHLIAFTDAHGRIHMYLVNPGDPPAKLDEKLSKSMIEKGLKTLVDDCDVRIKCEEQKLEKDENLLAELKKDRERKLEDLRNYRSSPTFQNSLHSRISRCSEILRAHSGKAVSIILLTTMLLENARPKRTDIDFPLEVPIR